MIKITEFWKCFLFTDMGFNWFFQRKNLKSGSDTGIDVTMVDVYSEFNERIAEKFKIPKFKSKVRESFCYLIQWWINNVLW